ncbi:uroporphyrinogen-III synthase [Rhizobiales bacterium]|uniref:uroporphyrinogen-III synthase n=1 Tax=Hongsoonwoonella zoysiae TaxID=2821844 RepID=UPI0015604E79|nr:uroporphyrinogen-III synthase [Hongsoonwoonella zoysiae]
MRLLVTRPEPQASKTAARLRALGHDAVVAPLLEVEAIVNAEIPCSGIAAVAVTSARAIDAVLCRDEWKCLRDLPVFAVGEKSARAAKDAGAANVATGRGTVGDLAALIGGSGVGSTVLYLAGRERSGDLGGKLAAFGIDCRTVEIYAANVASELPDDVSTGLETGGIDAVLVYSRRSAETFERLTNILKIRRNFKAFSISKQAGEPLAGRFEVITAREPNEEALFALLPPPC